MREQVGQLIHVPNTWYMEAQGRFAQALSERSFGGKAFFCNSGAEANEAAIKLASAHGHAAGKIKIITMQHGFHGRTYAALTATAQPKYHDGFEPMVPGFEYVPYRRPRRRLGEVRRPDRRRPGRADPGRRGRQCALGRIPGRGCAKLCDAHGALLILDEVQTGLGRTGKWFAYQHSCIPPDILTCAKALAGGVAAGVMLASPEVAETLKPGMHASTFGGNPIACRAGLATVDTIEEDGLLARGRAIGERFRGHFERLRTELPGLIKEIRIMGVMIGLELRRGRAGGRGLPEAPLPDQCDPRHRRPAFASLES